MIQHKTLNVKLSSSQLNKSESGKNKVTLQISWNVVGVSNDGNNFPHKLLLTNTQVSKLFEKKLLKTVYQLIKIIKNSNTTRQSGEFLGRLLLKTGLPLIGNVLKPLPKSVLIPSKTIDKEIFGSGVTELIILNEQMNDIMKIVKSPGESDLLIKDVSKIIKNEAKKQKGGFLGILLGALGPSLIGNL